MTVNIFGTSILVALTPILNHFSPILAIIKIFTSVLTLLGGKFFFVAKVPKKWSSFFKKIHCIFRHIRRGVKPDMTFVPFFFLKASLTYLPKPVNVSRICRLVLEGESDSNEPTSSGGEKWLK